MLCTSYNTGCVSKSDEVTVCCLKGLMLLAAGGFYSPAYDGIIYNPFVGSSSAAGMSRAAPNTNAVVNFTASIETTMDAWTGTDGSYPTGQDRYLEALDSYLRINVSPMAYAEVLNAAPGSVKASTGVIIPYSNTDQASASGANAAVASLKSTLASDSGRAGIFSGAGLGAVSASDITSSGDS